jgi:long-chain acyl-CoA synthetase
VTSAAVDPDIERVPRTIAALPLFASGRHPRPDLLGRCRGGEVDYVSASDLLERVRALNLALVSLGLTAGDRVALLSESRPEWLIADFAVLASGAVTTPVYPTLSAEQTEFILRDSGASMVFVSTAAQLAKTLAIASRLPALKAIVGMDVPPDPGAVVPVHAMRDLIDEGHRQIVGGWGVAREYHERVKQVRPEDLATIVYTSGTTGEPKGVMLTHANLIANIHGVLDVLDFSHEDVALSFLPLCHAFERIVAYIYLTTGVSAIFAESFETVARDLLAVRPTLMSGVPRVYEKLHARIVEKAAAASLLRRRMFAWAANVARRRGAVLPQGGSPSWTLRVQSRLADRLVFKKIREAIGGRLRYTVSGSAALNQDIARFFYGAGIPIMEGYGLTETAPVISVVPYKEIRFGTVGPPLSNVEIAFSPEGEILVRGPNVMRGYYNRPDLTADVLVDGWFRTGDIGTLDERGYLKLTDRRKELIVTSGGKKIAPQPIEDRFRAHPLVGEVVLVGEGRHFPAALIVPDFAVLAATLGIDRTSARARVTDEAVCALFQKAIDSLNAPLAQFERVKKFTLLADDFSIDSGELTPTLKVKRRVIEQKYRDAIDGLYAGPYERPS